MLPIKEVSAEADTELHADVVQALDEMRQEMRALVKRVDLLAAHQEARDVRSPVFRNREGNTARADWKVRTK